jgi:hypothetical protein
MRIQRKHRRSEMGMITDLKIADEDAEIETAAAVIEDLLFLMPPEKRAAVLAKATQTEAKERIEQEKNGGLNFIRFDNDEWMQSPGIRYWHDIMRFKAQVIYTFTRNITNNHSKEDAAKLLFSQQRNCSGSGYLEQYLDGVMPLAETIE